jgi:hypothetical protein
MEVIVHSKEQKIVCKELREVLATDVTYFSVRVIFKYFVLGFWHISGCIAKYMSARLNVNVRSRLPYRQTHLHSLSCQLENQECMSHVF